MKNLEQDPPLIGENHASNNWVISGKHTANGKPLIANDPHLSTSVPAVWQLMDLNWGDTNMRGASLIGIPLIGVGTNGHMAFG